MKNGAGLGEIGIAVSPAFWLDTASDSCLYVYTSVNPAGGLHVRQSATCTVLYLKTMTPSACHLVWLRILQSLATWPNETAIEVATEEA